MTDVSSYSTGTVAISANGTTVAGTGSNWSGQNAMSGDTLSVAGFGQVMINSITDETHLAIDAWPFGAVSAGTGYSIKQTSPLRIAGAQSALAVDQMVSALNTNGFYVFVGPDDTVPDPSLGDDEQYALQATTGKTWQKEGGVWTFVGTLKGFGTPGAWNSSTAYNVQDVVTLDGTSYVCIQANTNEEPSFGTSPSNAYWVVLAEKGDAATISVGTVTTGAGGSAASVTNIGTSGDAVLDFTIPAGEGYGGTSTTSLAIGTGSKAFTTQSGLAYTNGARVRASSAADTTNWMEGIATYSGTALTINVSKTNGSGTHADWNLNVVGEPGAGDLSSTNNLSDVANTATALANLGGVPTTTTISGSGLVTGGGDLSADRTVTVTAASKSDQQTATSAVLAVTPAHQQDHDSAAKVWAIFDSSSTPIVPSSYNVSSVVKNGTGDFTINFTTPFASANFVCIGDTEASAGNGFFQVKTSGRTASSVRIQCLTTVPALFDPTSTSIVCYGRQ